MHSVWTMHTLFITVKFVSQSQQMRAKKKKKSRKREVKNVDAEPKRGAQTRTISLNDLLQLNLLTIINRV